MTRKEKTTLVLSTVSFFLIWLCALALIVGAALDAHAQTGGFVFSERGSSRPHGEYLVAWNTTGVTIPDGTVVMSDTSGVGITPAVVVGKGFSTWDADTSHVRRVLGILIGNCPGYSQGRILTRGFHPYVRMEATAYAALTDLKPSLKTAGTLGQWSYSDSLRVRKRDLWVGTFQRYSSVDSLRGYVWVDFGVR